MTALRNEYAEFCREWKETHSISRPPSYDSFKSFHWEDWKADRKAKEEIIKEL